MRRKEYSVYIMASRSRTLYTGISNDLMRRVYEHKTGSIEGFTKKYNVTRLVYFELTNDVEEAIAREKRIKAWTRAKRVDLIESMNPTWQDLSESWSEKADSSLCSE
jgi:putative endonuclease